MKKSVKIDSYPLDVHAAMKFVQVPSCGAQNIFIGTIRNENRDKKVLYIDFDCYEAMAVKVIEDIAERALDRFSVECVWVHHRKGRVFLQDVAVVVATAAKHRDAAFLATRFVIDQLKAQAPIWKKEYYTDGYHWINSTP